MKEICISPPGCSPIRGRICLPSAPRMASCNGKAEWTSPPRVICWPRMSGCMSRPAGPIRISSPDRTAAYSGNYPVPAGASHCSRRTSSSPGPDDGIKSWTPPTWTQGAKSPCSAVCGCWSTVPQRICSRRASSRPLTATGIYNSPENETASLSSKARSKIASKRWA